MTGTRPVVSFLGAAGTVTGSRFLVRHGSASVLVDCGLFQGPRSLRLRNREPFPVDPRSIDAVVVTGMSCHADRDELVAWVEHAAQPPGAVLVVHGEPDASLALQQRLADVVDGPVVVPADLERVVV